MLDWLAGELTVTRWLFISLVLFAAWSIVVHSIIDTRLRLRMWAILFRVDGYFAAKKKSEDDDDADWWKGNGEKPERH